MTTTSAALAAFINHRILKPYPHQVIVGPVVWHPSNGRSSQTWGFVVSAGEDGGEPHHDQITADEEELIDVYRANLILTLATHRPPLVIHNVDDELRHAQLCAAQWPTKKSKRLLAAVQKEREAQKTPSAISTRLRAAAYLVRIPDRTLRAAIARTVG